MPFRFDQSYPSHRSPVLARNMVATSHPLAAQAGIRMLWSGGNAVDAGLAAAITLTLVEPTGNGLGSDAFAIYWDGNQLHGLNGSGRSPQAWTPEYFAGQTEMPVQGWDSITVPGAVSAWVTLSERFGQLPFARLFEPAIAYAREGFAISPITARYWKMIAPNFQNQHGFADYFMHDGRTPEIGAIWNSPAMANSLQAIAESKGESFYRGDLAEQIVAFSKRSGGALTIDDLATHQADWVGTISVPYRGYGLHEIPPNGQGIAALIALGILERFDLTSWPVDSTDSLHVQIEAMKLGFADLYHHIATPEAMHMRPANLLDPNYLDSRSRLIDMKKARQPNHGIPSGGGTVYLTAADDQGRMLSFIQSNFDGFGSGIVLKEAGIHFQNRGSAFSLDPTHPNHLAPGKRPFHTIIPGFLMHKGNPCMSFGVMGAEMQAQGHVQMVVRIVDYGQDPQTALDAPRWRVQTGNTIILEHGLPAKTIEGLRARGHQIDKDSSDQAYGFGGGQIIWRAEDGYIAGSDSRKDGAAVGF